MTEEQENKAGLFVTRRQFLKLSGARIGVAALSPSRIRNVFAALEAGKQYTMTEILKDYPFVVPHFRPGRSKPTDVFHPLAPVPDRGWITAATADCAYDRSVLKVHAGIWEEYGSDIYPYDSKKPHPPLMFGEELRFYKWYHVSDDGTEANYPNDYLAARYVGYNIMTDEGLSKYVYPTGRNALISCWGNDGQKMIVWLSV
jgi:hypothetical protein